MISSLTRKKEESLATCVCHINMKYSEIYINVIFVGFFTTQNPEEVNGLNHFPKFSQSFRVCETIFKYSARSQQTIQII